MCLLRAPVELATADARQEGVPLLVVEGKNGSAWILGVADQDEVCGLRYLNAITRVAAARALAPGKVRSFPHWRSSPIRRCVVEGAAPGPFTLRGRRRE